MQILKISFMNEDSMMAFVRDAMFNNLIGSHFRLIGTNVIYVRPLELDIDRIEDAVESFKGKILHDV